MTEPKIGIMFGDIVEENGKTIRENNMEKQHDLEVGTLVEVQYDEWHGEGACAKVHARLWVVLCERDCDGTPLYWLSKTKPPIKDRAFIYYPDRGDGREMYLKEDISRSIINNFKGGFTRESLTPVKVTEELKKGCGSLSWKERSGSND